MKQLKDKIALVTGASTGIGKAVALLFASEGANVIITSNTSTKEGNEVLSQLRSMGSKSIYISADLQKKSDIDMMFETINKEYGKLDILVNNAGRTYNVPFESIDEDTFERDLNVNLSSAVFCSKAAVKLMNNEGWIINTASIRGLPNAGRAGIIGYSAAKAAIISLTKTLAMHLAPNIYVNAVAPGFVYTNYMSSVTEDMKQQWLSQIPIKRFIMPEEIAQVYLMLATSRIFTGSVITPDGGYTLLGR